MTRTVIRACGLVGVALLLATGGCESSEDTDEPTAIDAGAPPGSGGNGGNVVDAAGGEPGDPSRLELDRALDFGEVAADEVGVIEAEARVQGGEPLTVQGYELRGEAFEVTFLELDDPPFPLKLEPGGSFAYQVSFESGEPAVAEGELEFFAGIPGDAIVELRANEPCARIDEIALLYGDVAVGESSDLEFEIESCNTSLDIEVSSIEIHEGRRGEDFERFSIVDDPTPTALAPGERLGVAVRFEPVEVGEHTSVIWIETRAGEFAVRTRGFGVEP